MNDDFFDVNLEPIFTPRMIDKSVTIAVLKDLRESVKEQMKLLGSQGWRFYPVTQTRGRCYFRDKVITLPSWALKREMIYRQWYVCHEMAHAFAGLKAKHGPEFMAELKRICPEESLHFEIEYKPRNAIAAGIRDKFDLDML